MALADALRRLYDLSSRGARRSLDPMLAACAEEGNPQDDVPTVHVGGTNGKGSVAASIEAIARAAGLCTGLYTSPHLVRFAERIRIDGRNIEDALLERGICEALDRHPSLTFFEIATLIAFRAFREARVDLAIIEVGLGGRLDATNVLSRPRAVAITTIGYDHMDLLGEDIGLIAAEKAAILKGTVPVVTGPLPRVAADVVALRAKELDAISLWRVGEEVHHRRRAADHLVIQGPLGRSSVATPNLVGAHQDDNAAIAAAVSWTLRTPMPGRPPLPIEDVAIAKGLAQVDWPGRFETVRISTGILQGTWILDGAHNEDGAHALASTVDMLGQAKSSCALVFGSMSDKSWGSMLRILVPRFGTRVYVEPTVGGPNRSAAQVGWFIALDPHGSPTSSVVDALRTARRLVGSQGTVVVAGSLYLVGEARTQLLGLTRDPQVGL